MRTISDLFSDPGLFATSAIAILVDRFGADCVNWEQETMEMELRGMGVIAPDDALYDKIAAATTVMSSDTPHWDVMVFNNIVQVFNFNDINPNSFIPASLEDVLWGCAEMRLLEGQEQYDSASFSAEIKDYVGKLLVQHGITTPPSMVEFADISEKMIMDRDDNLGADSLMFEAYWEEQRDNVTDMERFIKDRTKELLDQLASIPFINADSAFIDNAQNINKEALESKGRKTHIRGKGENKATVAARPLSMGTDLGKVVSTREIITPQGQSFVTQDLKEFIKNITQAVPGNTQVSADSKGDPRLYTTQPVQQNERITTDLKRQSVIPNNIHMLNNQQ